MSDLPPALRRHRRVDAAQRIFRAILGGAAPHEVFGGGRLTFSEDKKRLYEFTSNENQLAEAVLGMDFPRIVDQVELVHYTPVSGLRGIVAAEALHLRSVARNLPYGEFTTFARAHDFDGYFVQGQTGQQVYKELSDDLFYLSLTEADHPDEGEMWREFAGGGAGVRLRLRITPKPPSDLRRIGYQTGTPTAFKRINDDLQRQLGLVYVPWGVSRICAFYLPVGFRPEREVRLLIKRHVDGDDRTITSGQAQVWPVALGTASAPADDLWCGIELVGVDVGPRGSIQTVQSILAGTRYAGVPVR